MPPTLIGPDGRVAWVGGVRQVDNAPQLFKRVPGGGWATVDLPGVLRDGIARILARSHDDVFVLHASGDVFRSRDGGATWTRPFRHSGEITEAVFDIDVRDHGRTLYVSTQQGLFRW